MKNDHFFKFVAVIIVAGVIVALAGPARAIHAGDVSPEPTAAVHEQAE